MDQPTRYRYEKRIKELEERNYQLRTYRDICWRISNEIADEKITALNTFWLVKLFQELMKTELVKPCPFCGGYVVNINRTNPQACWIECDGCGVETRSHPKRKKALEIWNARMNVNGYGIILHDDDKENANALR